MTGPFIQDRLRPVISNKTLHQYRKLRYVNLLSWDCVISNVATTKTKSEETWESGEKGYTHRWGRRGGFGSGAAWGGRSACVSSLRGCQRVCVWVCVCQSPALCVMVDRPVLDAALYTSGSRCTPLQSWDLCRLKLMCSCLLARRNNYSCLLTVFVSSRNPQMMFSPRRRGDTEMSFVSA